jgi:dihydrofolate synthase / folylpolyglutamate synthase
MNAPTTNSFVGVKEAFAFIEGFTNLEKTNPDRRHYRLDRMRRILHRLGDPHLDADTVHVAGSKGKGSTASFCAAVLSAAGQRTGLYMSPHVSSYTERITLAGVPFDEELYVRLIEALRDKCATIPPDALPAGGRPTTFELLTSLAFMAFRESGCAWDVVEVGIGGRLDATNLVRPKACIITPIELEHTELLGDTLEKIAAEKAGIIKDGAPVFVGRQHPESLSVLRRTAEERGSPCFVLDEELEHLRVKLSTDGTDVAIKLRGAPEVRTRLALLGEVQAENAALATLALFRTVPELDPQAVARGLAAARIPGRMELIGTHPPFVLDGSHTPASAERLVPSLRAVFPEPRILIFGSVLGKQPERIASILSPHFQRIIITTPGTFKKSDPEGVFRAFSRHHDLVQLVPDPNEALREAIQAAAGRLPIVVTGSFYLLGEIRPVVRNIAGGGTA